MFSPLVKKTLPHHNKHGSRKGKKIDRVILHHWAGTIGGDTSLAQPDRRASVNYFIYTNGDVWGQVPETYRPWTTGSSIDESSITFEIQNSTGAPGWEISASALEATAKLIADIAKRHNWGRVTSDRVKGHRDYRATECPGPYVYPRIGKIIARANYLMHLGSAPEFPLPKGFYYGPRNGPAESVSGMAYNQHAKNDVVKSRNGVYYSRGLQAWQQQMRNRGWAIKITGKYDEQTQIVARKFQRTVRGLAVDSLIGAHTWRAAWTA